jgi:hypothetical protein
MSFADIRTYTQISDMVANLAWKRIDVGLWIADSDDSDGPPAAGNRARRGVQEQGRVCTDRGNECHGAGPCWNGSWCRARI